MDDLEEIPPRPRKPALPSLKRTQFPIEEALKDLVVEPKKKKIKRADTPRPRG